MAGARSGYNLDLVRHPQESRVPIRDAAPVLPALRRAPRGAGGVCGLTLLAALLPALLGGAGRGAGSRSRCSSSTAHQFQFAGYYAARGAGLLPRGRAGRAHPRRLGRQRAGARRGLRQGRVRRRRQQPDAGAPGRQAGGGAGRGVPAFAVRAGDAPDQRRAGHPPHHRQARDDRLADRRTGQRRRAAGLPDQGRHPGQQFRAGRAELQHGRPDQRQGGRHRGLHHQRAGHLRPPRLPV